MLALNFFFAFLFFSFLIQVSSFLVVMFIPLVFLVISFLLMDFSSVSLLAYDGLIIDEFMLFLNFMSAFVMMAALSSTFSIVNSMKEVLGLFYVFVFMVISVFYTFSSSSIFFLYMSYEVSLLPIIYIIIKWGSYPERSLSSIMMFSYTAIFSLPFIFILFHFYKFNSTFMFFMFGSEYKVSFFLVLLAFLTFSVKLPIYGLHFWLPMAHVEAPTFGSVILAGILLKLGGVGLIRLSSLLAFNHLRFILLSYFLVFLIYSVLVCMFQSDFKRLVAYSSVSHMMTIPLMIMAGTIVSWKICLTVMVFHGLSSPLLFMLVGVLYSMYSSRQLILMRGLMLVSPLLSFMLVLAFFFTLPAPPFLSFFSEVFMMVSCFFLDSSLLLFFMLLAMFSLIYNLNWLSGVVFFHNERAQLMYESSVVFFLDFCMMFFLILFSFVFVFLIVCF